MSRNENIFSKVYKSNRSEKVLKMINVKNIVPWGHVIEALDGEEILGTFYEKELKKTNETEFRNEKVIKKKVDYYMLLENAMIICLNNWIDKKDMCEYINFAEKVDLDSLKTDVGKFDIDKLKIVPTIINNMKSKVNKINIGKLKTGDLKN